MISVCVEFLSSVGSLFHNLGAEKEKARSAVLSSSLQIVFGTTKEILSRERIPGREGTRQSLSSDRYVGALSWTHLKERSTYSIHFLFRCIVQFLLKKSPNVTSMRNNTTAAI